MENLSLGLMLTVVGMVTVFIILLIVIFGSQGLINLINKIVPEEAAPAKATGTAGPGNEVKAILEAAVAQLTGGKGKITKITEI